MAPRPAPTGGGLHAGASDLRCDPYAHRPCRSAFEGGTNCVARNVRSDSGAATHVCNGRRSGRTQNAGSALVRSIATVSPARIFINTTGLPATMRRRGFIHVKGMVVLCVGCGYRGRGAAA
jgi:hypothetical protein